MIDPALFQGLALAFGLLFLVSGGRKLAELRAFQAAMAGYRLLPRRLTPVAGAGLAGAEVAVGLAAVSLFAELQLIALAASGGLLLLYAGAMAVNLLRGRHDVDCGCTASAARRAIGWDMVLRNLALAGLALLPPALSVSGRALTWLDGVTIAGVAAMLFIAYGTIEAAMAVPRRRAWRAAS